jgi:hypothetical protein
MDAAGWNHCPYCRQEIEPENSGFEEMACPTCGRHLWFIAGQSAAFFFKKAAELDHILVFLDENGLWSELGADSLDVVEIKMEWEERLLRN